MFDKFEVRTTRYEVKLNFTALLTLNSHSMQDLKERTFQFAIRIGKFINALSYNQVNKAYSAQLIRCSSSVGANYRAAKRAKSTPDFLNKLKIVEEECDESIYFLELLKEFNPLLRSEIDNAINEAIEILKIIVASINTTRNKLK
jgi:four helix bundle protein